MLRPALLLGRAAQSCVLISGTGSESQAGLQFCNASQEIDPCCHSSGSSSVVLYCRYQGIPWQDCPPMGQQRAQRWTTLETGSGNSTCSIAREGLPMSWKPVYCDWLALTLDWTVVLRPSAFLCRSSEKEIWRVQTHPQPATGHSCYSEFSVLTSGNIQGHGVLFRSSVPGRLATRSCLHFLPQCYHVLG